MVTVLTHWCHMMCSIVHLCMSLLLFFIMSNYVFLSVLLLLLLLLFNRAFVSYAGGSR